MIGLIRSACRLTSPLRVGAAFATLASLAATGPTARANPPDPSIVALERLPGHAWAQGSDLSSNGQFVLSFDCEDVLSNCRGAIWSAARGLEEIPMLPDADEYWALAQSGNGQAATGESFGAGTGHAFLWRRGQGVEDLGTLPGGHESGAWGIDHDGSAVAGFATTELGESHAMRWTRHGGMEDLGTLPGGSYSWAFGISMDGGSAAGVSGGTDGERAFLWTAAGMEDLGVAAPGDWSGAYAVDADGSAVTGYSNSSAVRWTREEGMVSLGACPGGTFSVGYGISGDGESVGGGCDSATSGFGAMLWTQHLGMVEVSTLLSSLGVDMSEWVLYVTTSLDADGTTIMGVGDYQGEGRTWVARIPRTVLHGK